MIDRNNRNRIAAGIGTLVIASLLAGYNHAADRAEQDPAEVMAALYDQYDDADVYGAYGSGLAWQDGAIVTVAGSGESMGSGAAVETAGSGQAASSGAAEEAVGSGQVVGSGAAEEAVGSGQVVGSGAAAEAAGSGQAMGSGAAEESGATWSPFGDESNVTAGVRGENGYYQTGLPILDISLPDGVNIATINTGSKETKYKKTSVLVCDADGTSDSYYTQVTFKGHGNSTWLNDRKKPYALKFSNKVNLFGLGSARRWLLLANSYDPSFLRNEFTFRITQYMNMPGSNSGTFADLYVDGTYLGCYYVCHKTEIGTATLNLTSELGVLCEWDEIHPAGDDDVYFKAPMSHKRILRIDTVHEENEDQAFDEFRKAFSILETAIWNGDWETASMLMDVHSFAQYYVIEEFAKNEDASGSSFYMYKDGSSDVIHAGPIWDMDLAYGNAIYSAAEHPEYNSVEGAHAFNQNDHAIITRMLEFEEFREEVRKVYTEEFLPAYQQALVDLEQTHDRIALSAMIDHEYWNRVSFEDGYAYFQAWVTMRLPYAEELFLGE